MPASPIPENLRDFAELHVPALERDEIRFGLPIAVITAAAKEMHPAFCYWTLGAAGHCAVKSPGRGLLLGDLEQAECAELARATLHLDYPGVAGADQTARWFVEHATNLQVKFREAQLQRINVLWQAPHYPAADGLPRTVTCADAALLFDWLEAFHAEAVPHDPPPEQANIEKLAASGRCLFWTKNDRPVSVAAIIRYQRHSASIAPVYTPPEHRGNGYAGSATAALADRIFAEGKAMVSLYTNMGNVAANRCYAKIGFRPYCDAAYYLRDL